jgi:hypothetical protein
MLLASCNLTSSQERLQIISILRPTDSSKPPISKLLNLTTMSKESIVGPRLFPIIPLLLPTRTIRELAGTKGSIIYPSIPKPPISFIPALLPISVKILSAFSAVIWPLPPGVIMVWEWALDSLALLSAKSIPPLSLR